MNFDVNENGHCTVSKVLLFYLAKTASRGYQLRSRFVPIALPSPASAMDSGQNAQREASPPAAASATSANQPPSLPSAPAPSPGAAASSPLAAPPSVTLTNEQFQLLLDRFQSQQIIQHQVPVSTGSFAKCASRFSGDKNSDISAFIDAIEIYKDCTQISDQNALKGLPILLDGLAATWWQGVKATVHTWQQALDQLRGTYGPKKPPHRIYRELFSAEQDSKTPTDVFICRSRALLAQLPPGTLMEETQLDMIYGLLHKKIREKIPRDKVSDFSELLDSARLIEETFQDSYSLKDSQEPPKRPRCAYCRTVGHSKDECRKLLSKTSKPKESETFTKQQQQDNSSPAVSRTTTVSCYGCGKPGFIRANCPTCKNPAESSSIDFCVLDTNQGSVLEPQPRPLLYVDILGSHGSGYVDTGSKQSVAGYTLYKILQRNGQKFDSQKITVKLADGIPKLSEVLVTEVDVQLQGRSIRTKFLIFPDSEDNSTLFGIDFIQRANILFNFVERTWNFLDAPENQYELCFEKPKITPQIIDIEFITTLRANEGQDLSEKERSQLDDLLKKNEDIFRLGEVPPLLQNTQSTQETTNRYLCLHTDCRQPRRKCFAPNWIKC